MKKTSKILTFRVEGGKWHFLTCPFDLRNAQGDLDTVNPPDGMLVQPFTAGANALTTCRRFAGAFSHDGGLRVNILGAVRVPEVRLFTYAEINELRGAKRVCQMCNKRVDFHLESDAVSANNALGTLLMDDMLELYGIRLVPAIIPALTLHARVGVCPICHNDGRLLTLGMGESIVEACGSCLKSALDLGNSLAPGMSITLRKE